MTAMDGKDDLKPIIEALIFVSDVPLSEAKLKEIVGNGLDGPQIRSCVAALNDEYRKEGRSFEIIRVAQGYQMVTRKEYGDWASRLYKGRSRTRLSRAALETVAIIAYRQPIIRAGIEAIRGVGVDGVLATLLERNLIRIAGRQPGLGRPLLYATSREFLRYFGLDRIEDLPTLKEVVRPDASQ